MSRVLSSLGLCPLALLAACGQTNEQFDMSLRDMGRTDERGLWGRRGRIPDSSHQLDDSTKVLQWRWDSYYISPGMPTMYRRIGFWMPMGGIGPTLVREGCIVEW